MSTTFFVRLGQYVGSVNLVEGRQVRKTRWSYLPDFKGFDAVSN